MAAALMQRLRVEGVEFVVAPYEADAQMAYMVLQGEVPAAQRSAASPANLRRGGGPRMQVDAVITEDSDLLVFGCSPVWFKLESNGAMDVLHFDQLDFSKELPMYQRGLQFFQAS